MALPATGITRVPGSPVENEMSASTALEQLVASTQNVITKRIDLALLEGREIVSDRLQRIAWGAGAVLMTVVAWICLWGAVVSLLLPNADIAVRLAAFASINGVSAAIALGIGSRASRASKRGPAL